MDAPSLSLSAGPLARPLEADDDIAGFLPGLDVPVSLDDLIQRIRSVDDRVYRVAAGLLMALAALTALTGARTPVVWFKICPFALTGSAALLVAASLV